MGLLFKVLLLFYEQRRTRKALAHEPWAGRHPHVKALAYGVQAGRGLCVCGLNSDCVDLVR